MPPRICLGQSRSRDEDIRPRKIFPRISCPGAMARLAAVCLAGWLILVLCSPALADLSPTPSNLRIELAGDGSDWAGGDVTLAWNLNPEIDLAGYIIFWGPDSSSYTDDLDVGLVTSYTLSDLAPETHYFADLAHNNVGYLSAFSNEVSLSSAAVPLPGALWLFGTGWAGLAACRRWRRRPGR
jgi:hypothetical protein